MATDFTKLPNQIVVDLINTVNIAALVTTDMTFGPPSVNAGGAHRNTNIDVTATPNSLYVGTVNVNYDRVNIAIVPGTRSTTFSASNVTNIRDLIPQINARYGINLTPVDYVDGALPVVSPIIVGDAHDFQLVMGTNSLVFIGSLTLTIQSDAISLPASIPNNHPNGL